jgi:cyclohexa-1,5-dienecarbonyl-CoA hydratase
MTATSLAVDSGLATLRIEAPPVNVLTRGVLGDIRRDLQELSAERALRVLIVTAAGRHFSAGADVAEHLPPLHERLIPEFLATVSALEAFPVPVIAAVRGRCLGGGFELALAADFIVAAESATFGQPEIFLGVAPPAAAAWLPRRLGDGLAAEIVLTGDPITAAAAARAGLVVAVVADDELDRAAHSLAGRMTRHSAASLRVAKRMLRRSRPDARSALQAAGDLYLHDLMRTNDAVEGLQAFLQKRPPVWSHS